MPFPADHPGRRLNAPTPVRRLGAGSQQRRAAVTDMKANRDGEVLVVVYAAKSTQDRNLSIPEQLADCRDMAEENDWRIVGEFQDEGFSAYSGNRGPGLEGAKRAAAEAAAQRGHVVMLVAQAHDRFARGAGDRPGAPQSLGEIWHEMRRLNVWLRTAEDDEELRDEASVAAIGRRAHIDSQRKSKSVAKGMRRRARDRGRLAGGPRPYAYRWAEARTELCEDGKERTVRDLVPVPAEALVVRRIYADYLAGVSQMALAKGLTAERVPTVRGAPWCQASIRRVLANELYMGCVRHAGEVYRGVHEEIVSEETWRRAAARRDATARTKGGGGGRWPKGPHLMTKGLLRCSSCGSAMLPRTDPNRREGDYQVYLCDGRRRYGPDHCSQMPVARGPIDEALLAELDTRYLDLDAMRERMAASIASDSAIAAEALADADTEAHKAAERLTRVQRGFQDGYLEPDDYREQRTALLAEQEAAEAARARARDRAAVLAEARPLDAEEAVLRRLGELRTTVLGGIGEAPNLNALRRLLRELFKTVYYVAADTDHWSRNMRISRESHIPAGGAFLEPHLRAGALAHPDNPYLPKGLLDLAEQPLREGLTT
jgi:DNA invertase Pin-like site-specific DNA recombinase